MLLVRKTDRATRLAKRTEILTVARQLVTTGELRRKDLSAPDKAMSFLKLSMASLEHEVRGLMLLDVCYHFNTYLEPIRATLSQAAVYTPLNRQAGPAPQRGRAHHGPQPSGQAEASQADRQLTKAAQQALALIDVRLLDHRRRSGVDDTARADLATCAEGG